MAKQPFHLDDFFAIRTPLLPYAELKAWGEGLRSAALSDDAVAFQKAYADDQGLLRERLREIVQRPEVVEALFVSSPDLTESLRRWSQEPDGEKGQRTEMALVRYFNRMCHRPTPFGLFAGHSLGRLGEKTRIDVGPRADYRRKTRLDMDYLGGLVAEVQKHHDLRETLILRPNNSLYPIGGRLRMGEVQVKAGERHYHLVALDNDEFLSGTLLRATAGATLADLAQGLVNAEVTLPEAKEYIHELIDNQVLVPDLEPPTTGPVSLLDFATALEGAESTQAVAERLKWAEKAMRRLDAEGFNNGAKPYVELVSALKSLPGKVDRSRLWQVDLFKPAPLATLGRRLQEDLTQAIELIYRLTPPASQDFFKAFKEAFQKRYEQHWVPLVEALDPEFGVGLWGTNGNTTQAAPLLDGLTLRGDTVSETAPAFQARELYLLNRVMELNRTGIRILELGEADIKTLIEFNALKPMPNSFSCTVEVSAPSLEAMDAGNYQAYIHGAGGPSAARMFGRFCHGDPELAAKVSSHLRAEEAHAPEAVFAEVAHLPYGRMGNILCRPVFRQWEIPFLGRSGAPPEHWISIADLFVGLVGERLTLWSKTLDREVIPRLSSAANYRLHATDLFTFLGCLQDQGVQGGMRWEWGGLNALAFLPRVTSGKIVLARASWMVLRAELKPVAEAKDAPTRFREIQSLRRKRDLPRHILLADGDNELPLDLDNPLSVEALWGVIKQRESLRLVEDFPGGENLVATGPEGAFTHELVLPILMTHQPALAQLPKPDLRSRTLRHGPGSEWLYAKLYTGNATMDRVLTDAVTPLVRAILAAGEADSWHFVRYNDPDPHIRLRIHGDPTTLRTQVLNRLQQTMAPLLRDGWIWRLQLDSYEPEIVRYGGLQNLARAEQIFQADSEAALKILELFPGDSGTDTRWRLALASMDEYYTSAGLSLDQRWEVAQRQAELYAKEFGVGDNTTEHRLGERFRNERKALETILDRGTAVHGPLASGLAVLQDRTRILSPLFTQMRGLAAAGDLSHPVEELLNSFIHMSVIRLLRSVQRTQEMALYNLLVRLYRSQRAQALAAGASNQAGLAISGIK